MVKLITGQNLLLLSFSCYFFEVFILIYNEFLDVVMIQCCHHKETLSACQETITKCIPASTHQSCHVNMFQHTLFILKLRISTTKYEKEKPLLENIIKVHDAHTLVQE